MNPSIDINAVYKPSENVISKNIEGQVMIVPLISGVGNLNEEIFQLNATGSAVWERLDGKKRLMDIVLCLAEKYDAPHETIKNDVVHLIERLVNKKFVFEVEQRR